MQARGKEEISFGADYESFDSIELNLRGSCLTCKFISCCTEADELGAPHQDYVVGYYRFNALNDRCVV